MTHRTGRPRRYDLAPVLGYANASVALLSAWISELRERVIDQVIGLPPS